MRIIILALAAILLLPHLASAADPQLPGSVRASVDGTPYPQAGPLKFHASLPYLASKLGGLPEQMGGRIYSVENAADVLKRAEIDPSTLECKWFVLASGAADIVEFDLSNGRITRIIAVDRTANSSLADSISNQWKELVARFPAADPNTAMAKNTTKGPDVPVTATVSPERIEFHVDPVAWYLLYNDVPTDIAAAMSAKKPIQGMTVEEANLVFGVPDSVTHAEKHDDYVWTERVAVHPENPFVGMTVDPDIARDAVQAQVVQDATKETRISRTIGIRFVDGKAAAISDEHY
jgi:hypothetical protein